MTTADDIMGRLGGHRTGKTRMVRCPVHKDRTPSLAVRDAEGGIIVFCHGGCSSQDVIAELKRLGLWPEHERNTGTPRQRTFTKDDDAARTKYAREIWKAGCSPLGTLAELYLEQKRNLRLDDDLCGRVVRFHPECPFGKDEAGNRIAVPAMLLAFRPFGDIDPLSEPQAIHRIGLNRDGSKRGKMMLGPMQGCAIKIDDPENISGLGICEGFESGLGISQRDSFAPLWALGNAGAIKMFAPLAGVECLTIFADHDPTGLAAAQACKNMWCAAGREVFLKWRPTEGQDGADA